MIIQNPSNVAPLSNLRKARGPKMSPSPEKPGSTRPVIQPTFDEGLSDYEGSQCMRLFRARVRPMTMKVPSPR
jgi:hypothetical protein